MGGRGGGTSLRGPLLVAWKPVWGPRCWHQMRESESEPGGSGRGRYKQQELRGTPRRSVLREQVCAGENLRFSYVRVSETPPPSSGGPVFVLKDPELILAASGPPDKSPSSHTSQQVAPGRKRHSVPSGGPFSTWLICDHLPFGTERSGTPHTQGTFQGRCHRCVFLLKGHIQEPRGEPGAKRGTSGGRLP